MKISKHPMKQEAERLKRELADGFIRNELASHILKKDDGEQPLDIEDAPSSIDDSCSEGEDDTVVTESTPSSPISHEGSTDSLLGMPHNPAVKHNVTQFSLRGSIAVVLALEAVLLVAQWILVYRFGAVPPQFEHRQLLLFILLASDATIALSYFVIPLTLIVLVKKRKDIPFNWIFFLFAAFIVSCGITHIVLMFSPWSGMGEHSISVPTVHNSAFPVINATAKVFTAIVSLVTAIVSIALLPFIVHMPTPQQLQAEIQKQRHTRNRLQQYQLKLQNLKLQQAVQQSEKKFVAKSEFLSMLSHEIRTPVNAIIGMLSLLKPTKLDSEQQSYLQSMQQSADMLLGLLNQCLDFSKLESGKLELDSSPFNLRKCFLKIFNMFDLQAKQKNVELLLRIDDQIPQYAVGDRYRLSQVVINLVSNALKFTQARGKITIDIKQADNQLSGVSVGEAHPVTVVRETHTPIASTSTAQQIISRDSSDSNVSILSSLSGSPVSCQRDPIKICVCVSDTGIGIPKDKLQVLFQPFTQAHGTSVHTRSFGGTGLGLSVARQLVELMGGRIWVQSEVGVGSAFFFTAVLGVASLQDLAWIDKKERDHKVRKEANALEQSSTNQSENRPEFNVPILIADDNSLNQTVASTLLKKMGYQHIKVVDDGQQAVDEFKIKYEQDIALGVETKHAGYPVCILDVQMPNLTGPEAAQQIRALTSTSAKDNVAPFIVALTASPTEDVRALCVTAGMNEFLGKPFRAIELQETIGKFARQSLS